MQLKYHSPKRWIIIVAVIVVAALALPLTLILTIGGNAKDRLESHDSVAVGKQEPVTATTSDEKPDEKPSTTAPAVAPDTPVSSPADQYPVQLSADQAASITVVVNKKHKLPDSYVPNLVVFPGSSNGNQSLRPEASAALMNLFSGGASAGHSYTIISAYRSYNQQVITYNGWVAQDGQAAADTYSARPGYSEHQTGLAADLNLIDQSFGDTPAGQWLAAHAHEYGFIIRYPNGKDAITGYHYEPWHLRYLGVDVASAVYNSGLTLDEYYGVPGGGY